MCGIIAYTGPRNAAALLLAGLERLEYRGYDSAGVAIQNGRGLVVRKVAGRVNQLGEQLRLRPIEGSSGIAHTRWATHGVPNETNAHPHVDCSGRIAVAHNGIIENADSLRAMLERRGHVFRTETDTETLSHLIEDAEGDTLEERVAAALAAVEGTYGLAVVWEAEPHKVVAARRGSPVLLGVGDGEFFVASDPTAVVAHTRSVLYLEDGDLAVVTRDGYTVLDAQSQLRVRKTSTIDWSPESAERGGFAHFMLKEIFEQPSTTLATMRGRLVRDSAAVRLNGLNLTPEDCRRFRRIVVVACGTSWHAGLYGRYVLEQLVGIPVQVEYASEYRYQAQLDLRDTLVIAISQSGETADTLEAVRAARRAGARVVGLVNVVGSTIAREADGGVYLHAGPEVGVASTKAFTSQLVALLLLTVYLARHRGMRDADAAEVLTGLSGIPALIERTLELEDEVRSLAEVYAEAHNFLYLGRGLNFPVALEGALKLKEISYIHAEGLPAAEMKHGPIALIDEHMPVVFVAPRDAVYGKVLSNMAEVKARSGSIIAIATEGNGDLRSLADHTLRVPATAPVLSPLVTVIPLQLLAYHIAVLRGCDVDRPRNLAKSVTVE